MSTPEKPIDPAPTDTVDDAQLDEIAGGKAVAEVHPEIFKAPHR